MKAFALFAVLAWAAPPAWAQEDPLKDLKLGDRVEFTLRSGFAIQGKIISTTVDLVPIEKMKVITLDVSIEYPELASGHLGVERGHIQSVRKLPHLTQAELEAREKTRQQALKRMALEDSVKRKNLAEAEIELEAIKAEMEKRRKDEQKKGVASELKARAEMIERGEALYAKFPPPAWGSERLQEIGRKPLLKIPVTPEEQEFLASYDTWVAYKLYLEETKIKEKTKAAASDDPAPAPSAAPTPAPAPPKETPKDPYK